MNMHKLSATLVFLAVTSALASEPLLGFGKNSEIITETRSLDDIYKAALAEGGIVTMWHGGDEKNQQNTLKTAFETRFPGMTLNVTVDLSKYHDVNLDQQLIANNVYVDSIALQTLNDYPRWEKEDVLLRYAPVGLDKVHPAFKDPSSAFYGLYISNWSGQINTAKLPGVKAPKEWPDWLRTEFKDKLVITYPNDDDAVLYAFDLIMQQYGPEWFEKLLAQNPKWVRGTATPGTLMRQANSTYAATFVGGGGPSASGNITKSFPVEGSFVSWPQTGAILKDAPHPEGAKLLHNFILSQDFQISKGSWSVRTDVPAPAGFPKIFDMPGTNAAGFAHWMSDRGRVERLRFWFESRIGSAQGLSSLIDDI